MAGQIYNPSVNPDAPHWFRSRNGIAKFALWLDAWIALSAAVLIGAVLAIILVIA